jgi:hypothetical protein
MPKYPVRAATTANKTAIVFFMVLFSPFAGVNVGPTGTE